MSFFSRFFIPHISIIEKITVSTAISKNKTKENSTTNNHKFSLIKKY